MKVKVSKLSFVGKVDKNLVLFIIVNLLWMGPAVNISQSQSIYKMHLHIMQNLGPTKLITRIIFNTNKTRGNLGLIHISSIGH